mmetsp:Transcript_14585/g.43706  ORF Transcript_14585/g.43706 Transcript_14585/m.43706 type:complete len:241 (+) Transcript_14585:148-870(+)
MAEISLSPAVPTRLKSPFFARPARMAFSRRSRSCFRLATRHLEASFSAEASNFVASASLFIFSSIQPALMTSCSAWSSALIFLAPASPSAFAISCTRYVSSCVFVRSSCVCTSSIMTSALPSAWIRAMRASSSALTLRCSNSSSARLFRPLSETSTCSLRLLISLICISDSWLICSSSNSFCRLSFSIAFSIIVVPSSDLARVCGSQTEVIFTSENITPDSENLSLRVSRRSWARSPRRS